jgi:hypothetical protein
MMPHSSADTDVSEKPTVLIFNPEDGGSRLLRNIGTYLSTRLVFPEDIITIVIVVRGSELDLSGSG